MLKGQFFFSSLGFSSLVAREAKSNESLLAQRMVYDYLIARALQYEAQGHSVANAFIIHDHKHTGRIAASEAARLVCNILQLPSPLIGDEENTKARDKLLQDVGFKVIICFTICRFYFSIASMLPYSSSISPFVS